MARVGKNYTLYINVREFGDEANKSGLINQLLRKHYGIPEYKPLTEEELDAMPFDPLEIAKALENKPTRSLKQEIESLGLLYDFNKGEREAFDPNKDEYVALKRVNGQLQRMD